jgi:type I restriction enzyme S subunit
MNTKFLKQKILDLAIRGKLSQQLKSDGTAADLLKEICDRTQEKTSLRAKRGNPSPQTIIPLDKNEAPFEIPANWEWVRLGDVAKKITDGTHHSPVNLETGDFMYVTAKNIKDDGIHLENITYVSSDTHKEIFARCNPEKGDVLLIKDGATTGVVTVNNLEEPFSLLSSVALLKLGPSIESWYLAFVIRSTLFNQMIRSQMKGVGITRVTLKQIESFAFPLPPFAEQQRIVEKVQEAFAEIDSIENNKELLKTHIKQTRQKILDLAIHGKLVPQNKSDEPASVLLERITRDNPHYEKIENEPFEIPENWIWARINDINFFQSNTENPMLEGNKNRTYELYSVPCFEAKYPEIVKGTEIGSTKVLVNKGDVLISKINPHLNRVWCVPQFTEHRMIASSEWIIIRNTEINQSYLVYVLQSGYFLDKMLSNTSGVGGSLTRAKPYEVKKYEIPLPPLAEQSRIVAKIEELFSALDQMERNLV